MTGYTPLFGSLTTGTLCGRWPDIGLWPIILALADRSGVVDVTPQYVAGVTGLALPEVVACMDRFCQPDPYSRSAAEDGRRLVLLAPNQRNWGWQIVNFGLYREKARLMAKSMREVESGQNRDRLSGGPTETAAHRRSPPETAAERPPPPLIQDKTIQDKKEKNSPRKKTSSESSAREVPEDFALDTPMRDFALARHSDCDVEKAFEQFVAHHKAEGSKKKRWDMAWRTWVGNMEQFGYPKKRANGGWL